MIDLYLVFLFCFFFSRECPWAAFFSNQYWKFWKTECVFVMTDQFYSSTSVSVNMTDHGLSQDRETDRHTNKKHWIIQKI